MRHNYSDTAFYFITSGPAAGKRIVNADPPYAQPNFSSTSSDVFLSTRRKQTIFSIPGREWYQPVSYLKPMVIDPGFRDIIISEKVKYTIRVLARVSVSIVFRFSEGGSLLNSIPVAGTNLSSTTGTYAQASEVTGEALPSSAAPVYELGFTNNGEPSPRAWIDYVKLHARRHNTFDGNAIQFTDLKSVATGNVTEFTIKGSIGDALIWDVTDPYAPEIVQFTRSGETITFKVGNQHTKDIYRFCRNQGENTGYKTAGRSKPGYSRIRTS